MVLRSADIYVQIDKGQLTVANLNTGAEVAMTTLVAAPRRKGEKAWLVEPAEIEAARIREQQGRVELLDGFNHERVLIGNFEAASFAMKAILKRVQPSWWVRKGTVLMHIQREMEGGVTEVELRAVRDLAEYSGAREVRLMLEPATYSLDKVRRLLRDSASQLTY